MFQPAPGNAYVEPSIFVDNTKLKVVDSLVIWVSPSLKMVPLIKKQS